MSTRIYKGHTIAYREICQRYWIGGRGYVYTSMIEAWNTANPERQIILTPDAFFAITSPAISQAA